MRDARVTIYLKEVGKEGVKHVVVVHARGFADMIDALTAASTAAVIKFSEYGEARLTADISSVSLEYPAEHIFINKDERLA